MAIPVRLNGWKLPHKAPESHYSPRKGTRKRERSHWLFAASVPTGIESTQVNPFLFPKRTERGAFATNAIQSARIFV
jgi:hypothetical protein